MTCHCKHNPNTPGKSDSSRVSREWQFTLPTGWTAQQAWAIVELLNIISSDIWDIYEDKLIDHVRRKRQKTYDKSGKADPKTSYEHNPSGNTDLPF